MFELLLDEKFLLSMLYFLVILCILSILSTCFFIGYSQNLKKKKMSSYRSRVGTVGRKVVLFAVVST